MDRKVPAQITALDLERFAVGLGSSGLATISQGRTLAAVRSLFRFAERIGYCSNASLELIKETHGVAVSAIASFAQAVFLVPGIPRCFFARDLLRKAMGHWNCERRSGLNRNTLGA